MPTTLAFLAPWESSRAVANLPREPRGDVVVLLLESVAKGSSLPWHRQKLVLLLSSMQHFAASLESAGYRVAYRKAPSYAEGIAAAAAEFNAAKVVATEGREQDMVDELDRARTLLESESRTLTLREDRGFLATREEFATWARGRKEYRMEFFYREMRRKHGILMEADGTPSGGQWNFDADNRKPWPKGRAAPEVWRVEPDDITRAQMDRVRTWRNRWGSRSRSGRPISIRLPPFSWCRC